MKRYVYFLGTNAVLGVVVTNLLLGLVPSVISSVVPGVVPSVVPYDHSMTNSDL